MRFGFNKSVVIRTSSAIPVCVLSRAVRLCFRYAYTCIVLCDLVTIVTVVAIPVVELVGTVIDDINADLIVVLDLPGVAYLSAYTTGCAINFAILDWSTAKVIGDFHVGAFAVHACA